MITNNFVSFCHREACTGGGEYGVAVLSRYPILTRKSYALPTAAGSGGEPRALCTTVLQLPGGRKIMMASTHLDVQRNDSSRLIQIRAIHRIMGEAGMPAILAGDFNAPENRATIRTLNSSFTPPATTVHLLSRLKHPKERSILSLSVYKEEPPYYNIRYYLNVMLQITCR